MKQNVDIKAIFSVTAIMLSVFLTGCSAPKQAAEAFISAPVFESYGSMTGSFKYAVGVVMVKRAGGNVFFCNAQCSSIGKFELAETDHLAIHEGESDEVYITDDARGEVVRCTVEFQTERSGFNKKDKSGAAIFKSGQCATADVSSAPIPRA